jgi:uncharacterized protein (DUF1778 family)
MKEKIGTKKEARRLIAEAANHAKQARTDDARNRAVERAFDTAQKLLEKKGDEKGR